MSEESIFSAALEKTAPAERAAYLEAACAGDPQLRRRVEALLRAHEQTGDLLDPQVPDRGPRTEPAGEAATGGGRPVAEGPGTRIGPYNLLRKIGEGGMGAVFLAEQEHPVRRTVALKVIKPGMDSAQVIARLEAERQALALMDHPHIAKFLDAGTTGSGRPFFVMEPVEGIPITAYCDKKLLTPKERLELFVLVCQAIQHAHQKGIIHRDIKPSNVLVAHSDGQPVPKVIDFGVAKAIDQRLTERTLFTQLGAIVGTPEYMSPEQAGLSGRDVDTRSDIYSLGVLLYELLTGDTPLERCRLRNEAFTEILRRIREEEPPRPSTRLSTTEETASIASARGTEPAKLAKLVRGDLDWIVMKALEKDPARRYETANSLARDIRHHLDGDPVEAGPPSAVYRLRKLARKHRAALATAAGFAAVLVAATAISTWQAIRARLAEAAARHERDTAITARLAETEARRRAQAAEKAARLEADKAGAINRFLTDDLLSQAEPGHNAPEDHVTLLEVLDRAAAKVADRFGGQPEVEDSVRRTIAETYHGLASWEKAERQWLSVHEVAQRWHGPESAEALTALSQVAHIRRHRRGVDAEILDMARTASEGLARILGPDHPDTLVSRNVLAHAYLDSGRTAEALALHEETLKRSETKLGPDHPDTLISRSNLAAAYRAAGRTAAAIALLEVTLKQRESRLGLDHPETLDNRSSLASAYQDAGRISEALRLFEALAKQTKTKLGADHPETITALEDLAVAYLSAGRAAEAVPRFEEALKRDQGRLGADHPSTITTMQNLAVAYRAAGRLDEALPLLEQALALLKSRRGPDHPVTLRAMANLCVMSGEAGRLDEALALSREVLERMKAKHGPDHPDTLLALHNLAMASSRAGRLDEAIPMFQDALRLRKAKLGPNHPFTLHSADALVGAYLRARRWAEAEVMARDCLELRTRKPPDDWSRFHTMSQLGAALAGQKKYNEAEPLLIDGYEGLKARQTKIPAPSRGQLADAAARIVPFYEAWGKSDQAAQWRKKLEPSTTAKSKP